MDWDSMNARVQQPRRANFDYTPCITDAETIHCLEIDGIVGHAICHTYPGLVLPFDLEFQLFSLHWQFVRNS
jgi:hypothetical protein